MNENPLGRSSSSTPVLGYNNYEEWRIAIIGDLNAVAGWSICNGTELAPIADEKDPPTLAYNREKDWRALNQKAIGTIQRTLDASNFQMVENLTSAREVWLQLESKYRKTSVGRTYNLLEQLFSFPYSSNLSSFGRAKSQLMATFRASLPTEYTVDKLCGLILCLSIIRELPDKFASIRTNFITSSEIKIQDVMSALDAVQAQEDYEDKKGSDLVDAFSTSSPPRDQPIPLRTFKCQVHSSNSHTFADCQEYKSFLQYKQDKVAGRGAFGQRGRGGRRGGRGGNRLPSAQNANAAQDEEVDQSANFVHHPNQSAALLSFAFNAHAQSLPIADSGASMSMTPHKSWLVNARDKRVPVRVASGNVIHSELEGDVVFQPIMNGKRLRPYTIKNVLYVPALHASLLSVLSLTRTEGVQVSIKGSVFSFFSSAKDLLFTATATSQLAHLDGYVLSPQSAYSALPASKLDMELWHRRCCHISQERIKKAQTKELVLDLKISPSVHGENQDSCETCIAGKSHRLPFPPSESKASSEGVVVSDLKGPLIQSREGYRYWANFTVENSRYRYHAFLKHK